MSTRRSKVPLALAILVGAASAMSTSLGNLMMASASNQIPQSCLRVYNSPIPGCQESDFRAPNQCSQECLRGLEQLQQDIQRACQGVRTSGSTLLGRALQGGLVGTLCDNAGDSNQQPNPPSPPPVVPVPAPTRGGDGSSTASLPTQRPLNPNPQPAPQPTTAAQPPPVQTQTTLTPRPSNSNDGDNDDGGSLPGNGVGGSPFDIRVGTGSSTQSPMMFAAVIAILATIALLPVR